MLSFIAPGWLFGLALLPLIRWLHRPQRLPNRLLVSRLALWRESGAPRSAGHERRPPDSAWRRRALLAALFFVALAEPRVATRQQRVTLWIDDSLSMLTRETRGTRLAEGFAQARASLGELAGADLEVRTLGRPWRRFADLDDATYAAIAGDVGVSTPAAPPVALLRPESRHWLLTDGAHPALLAWDGETRADRVIRVGSVARNVGMERLSVRRDLLDPDKRDLLVKVTNGGSVAETRDVVVSSGSDPIQRTTVEVPAQGSVLVRASVAAQASVVASLRPHDALPEDDEIVLDVAGLRRRAVAVDPTCPRALAAAIAAHPGLAVADTRTSRVEARLDCGGPPPPEPLPTVRVRADRMATTLRGTARWSASVPQSRRAGIDAERIRVAAHLDVAPSDDVVLAIAGEPVIVRRHAPARLVETSLDFSSEDATRRPGIPLLVDLMFEQLLGEGLLEEVAVVDRGAGSARVAPTREADASVRTSAAAPAAARLRGSQRPMLAAALLVLVWELLALARQRRRAGFGDRADA